MNRNTIIALSLIGVVGLGAYLYVNRKKGEKTDGSDRLDPSGGGTYSPELSARFTRDRGFAVTAMPKDERGNDLPPEAIGSAAYRPGYTVSGNAEAFFGAASYRNTICTPTRQSVYQGGEAAYNIFGASRRQSDDNNGWAWNRNAIQTGEGWRTNAAAIIARSHRCPAASNFGTRNQSCRASSSSVGNRGKQIGALGLYPMNLRMWEAWRFNGNDGVPLMPYAGARDGSMPGARTYQNMDELGRTAALPGFLQPDGTMFTRSDACQNFKYISDENPSIEYFFAGIGQSGAFTAWNTQSRRWVPRKDLKPRWQGLSHSESTQFNSRNYDEKIDPWRIPDSPWEALDLMKSWSGQAGGREYFIDYRAQRGLNPTFEALGGQAPSPAEFFRSNSRYWVFYRDMNLSNPFNWPSVGYGLVNPYRDESGNLNGMPFDYGMPIWMNYLEDMPYLQVRFSGDVQLSDSAKYAKGLAGFLRT